MILVKLEKINNYLEKIYPRWLRMLALSFIPFLFILAPLLAGQALINSDLNGWIYPAYYFYQQSIKQGESIFWNPGYLAGFPNFTSTIGFFSPLNYVFFKLFSFFWAYNLMIILSLGLGLYFAWRLLLKFNLPFLVSYLGGLVYVFSQWFWMHDLTIANAIWLLPLLFLLVFKLKEKRSAWLLFSSGLAIGFTWLSVHLNWTVMILSALAVFALYLAWSEKRWVLLLKFALAVVIGSLIGLIIIYPVLKYSALSARASGLSYQEAATGAVNFGDLVRYLLPYFRLPFSHLAASPAQLYLGVLPLFFLIIGLRVREKLVRFFSFLFFLCLLTAFAYSPIFWFIHRLPGFNAFRGPARWMFIASLPAAVIASYGMRSFFSMENNDWTEKVLRVFKQLAYFLLLITVLSTLFLSIFGHRLLLMIKDYFKENLYGQTSGLPLAHYYSYIDKLFGELKDLFNLFNLKVLGPVVFILVSYWLLRYLLRKKLSLKQAGSFILIIVFLNFFMVYGGHQSYASIKEYFQEPATVNFIKKETEKLDQLAPKRIFSFMPGFSEFVKLSTPFLATEKEALVFNQWLITPNQGLFYGLESIDAYDNLMPRRISRVLALIGSDRATVGDKLVDLKISPEEKTRELTKKKKLLNLLGVRYLLSVFDLDLEVFNKVFVAEIPPYQIPLTVYENKGARPLLYFADRVEIIKEDELLAYQKLLDFSLEGKSVFLECTDCLKGKKPADLQFNGQAEVCLKRKTNDSWHLQTQSSEKRVLVFSENYLPGWQAFIDGRETRIYYANSIFMGIFVPAGQHEIIFKFRPFGL